MARNKNVEKRTNLEQLRQQLEHERSTFLSHWRTLGNYIRPRRPRFERTDVNKGDRRTNNIYDSTATLAARTLRSGMMSGITSPARPWFRLTVPDPKLAEEGPVKDWLFETSERMLSIFLRSNLYNVLPSTYGDVGDFGTAAIFMQPDADKVVHFFSIPIGSYSMGVNQLGQVNTFVREFRMTVRQVVDTFGRTNPSDPADIDWRNISTSAKNLYEHGNHKEAWIDVCHIIRPNPDWDPKKSAARFKPVESVYFEAGASNVIGSNLHVSGEQEKDRFLRESGFDYFPVLTPRWEVTGEDFYGTSCPGMDALGDIRGLQIMQKRKAEAIEKMVKPPMTGPSSLRSSKVSILPGDITYADTQQGQAGFRPSHEVNPRINELLLDIQDHQARIRRAYFEDLFLITAQSNRRNITATEIEERREEKLLALGPVLEQLNQDLLDPLIDNTFNIMLEKGLIPDPPDELSGLDLKVEYISSAAQAQKLIATGGIERFAGFASQIAQVNPETLDKIDTDQVIDIYAELTGIPPGIVRPDEKVDVIRQQRAEAQQKQQESEAMAQAADSAKKLSETDTQGDNALTDLISSQKAQQQGLQ